MLLTCLLLLMLPGAADRIDLLDAWTFQPETPNAAALWADPQFDDSAWPLLKAGTRWEDQGFPDVDGHAWYRKAFDAPEEWRGQSVWLVLGACNDACTVYLNGKQVNHFEKGMSDTMATAPVLADLTQHVRFGESNLIALRVNDYGGSGGLWKLPSYVTTNAGDLPLDEILAVFTQTADNKIILTTDLASLGSATPALHVAVRLECDDKIVTQETFDADASFISLDLPQSTEETSCEIECSLVTEAGETYSGISQKVQIPMNRSLQWPEPFEALRVLNNFVTLLFEGTLTVAGERTGTFLTPRDGWVFVRIREDGQRPPVVLVDESRLVWRIHPHTGFAEAMVWLSKGEHAFALEEATELVLEIRAVPELPFCYYPTNPHIATHGPYDWSFMTRHVLSNANVLVASTQPDEAERQSWLHEGRVWIGNAALPGLNDQEPPSPADVLDVWLESAGARDNGVSGIMVDEFLWKSAGHYDAWSEALVGLHNSPAFHGKTFYAWCGDIHEQAVSHPFCKLVTGNNDRFSWEKYLPEEDAEAAALTALFQDFDLPLKQWDALQPGVAKNIVMCLGYLSAPPESLNLNPSVNYLKFLDMQMRHLATQPAFFGMAGVMAYSSPYADEEALRYFHALVRHYCIEGNTEPFNTDAYALEHIVNPDFLDGMNGWDVTAGGKDSIALGSMEGYSYLQGRYPRTEAGDQYLSMTRCAEGPNTVSQTIHNLEPGRLYSVKLVIADMGDLHQEQMLALDVSVEGAEQIDEYSWQTVYASNYAHEVGPYTREHPAYMNYHRFVFKATAPTAVLAISDWLSPDEPGGPEGQQIAVNFVEVQPFYAP